MLQTIDIVEKSNPDIIDINFGCPVKKVVSKGAGAGILKDVCLMEQLTAEMVKRTNIPITVKTRLGWDNDSIRIVEVAERLQDVGCKAISIHGVITSYSIHYTKLYEHSHPAASACPARQSRPAGNPAHGQL